MLLPSFHRSSASAFSTVFLALLLLPSFGEISLTGTWSATATLPGRGQSVSTLTFTEQGDRLKGTAQLGVVDSPRNFDRIAVEKDVLTLELRLERRGSKELIRVVAELTSEGKLTGEWRLLDADGSQQLAQTWHAVRTEPDDLATIATSSPPAGKPEIQDPTNHSALDHQIPNFALLDHEGMFHDLSYHCRMPGVKGIVLFVQGNGCPLVRKRIPELKRLRDAYQSKGILFGMINANLQDDSGDITEEAEAYAIDFPILLDEAQLVADMLGIERTAEVFLIQAQPRRIFYRGAIDDRMSYQSERPETNRHYLADAIEALLAEKPSETAKTDAPGCKITRMNDADQTENVYSQSIAPILQKRCVQCHSKGGIGPFAMSSYNKIKGWSEMIEEVIMTKQMPPWHADPHVGKFSNDAALSTEEARSLVAWIRAGCLRGTGPDPLEGYRPVRKEWQLGEPDHVMRLPAQSIPAEGVLDYRYVHLKSPFERDVWLRAVEVNPGNARVLHHVVITEHTENPSDERRRRSEKWLAGYAPGTGPSPCPEGSGIFLPADAVLRFQLHYTVSGKVEEDLTRIGLYLCEAKPAKEFHTGVIIHPKFRIPPHDNDFEEHYTRTIKRDILIYGMNPHMHYRGKRMSFEARHPDGTVVKLLSVPNYNFNWQRTYHPVDPIFLPAGTKLTIRNAWDNSSLNGFNPDPSAAVTWGEQSFQEMFFATYTFVEADHR